MTNEQKKQCESIGKQLDLIDLLTIKLTREEIKSALEMLTPSMLGVIKNLCILVINNCEEIA